MGSWGVKAFQSDSGLDAVAFIRDNLPEDGRLELGKIMEALRKDKWNAPPDVQDGVAHSSFVMLAEIIAKAADGELASLDWDDKAEKLFGKVTSFSAAEKNLQELRDYLSGTLKYAREIDESGLDKWSGWFKEKDWLAWQEHMEGLVERMDALLASSQGSGMELLAHGKGPAMEMT